MDEDVELAQLGPHVFAEAAELDLIGDAKPVGLLSKGLRVRVLAEEGVADDPPADGRAAERLGEGVQEDVLAFPRRDATASGTVTATTSRRWSCGSVSSVVCEFAITALGSTFAARRTNRTAGRGR